jgi:RHS repeat-associated protein
MGREIQRDLGDTAVVVQSWDPAFRLHSQTLAAKTSRGTRSLQRRHYDYRPDGYVTRIVDQLAGPLDFDLDVVGRVTAVRGDNGSEQYAYDPAGNLTDAAWTDPRPRDDADARGTREYSGTFVRRAGGIYYQHDAQGRVIQRQRRHTSRKADTWHYTWDAYDRLVAVTTPDGQRWQYHHDPLGRRITKQRLAEDGGILARVEFTWDGTLLAEQRESNNHTTTWEYEPGTFAPLAQTERHSLRDVPQHVIDERFYSIVSDLAGAPRELVTPQGELVWHGGGNLWGSTTGQVAAPTPIRFPGQYADPESGLHYNYFRHYDPDTGRYASADPLGLDGGPDPHSYVRNPVSWADPLGLAPYNTERILWGQARVSPTYSNRPNVPDYLRGRSLEDVAKDLDRGRLNPDQFRVVGFRHEGQLITNNNRSLTVLSMAGKHPTNLRIIESNSELQQAIRDGDVDHDVLDRLRESTPLGDVLPANRIAITPSQEDWTVKKIVYLPGEGP